MSKGGRWILVKTPEGRGELIEASEYYTRKVGPIVVRDIAAPFLSMADGKTVIHSRSQYRDHLRRHGMREVGNEPLRAYVPPTPNPAPTLKDVYQNRHSPGALYNIRRSGRIND